MTYVAAATTNTPTNIWVYTRCDSPRSFHYWHVKEQPCRAPISHDNDNVHRGRKRPHSTSIVDLHMITNSAA